jgi:hypothetical protein
MKTIASTLPALAAALLVLCGSKPASPEAR